MGTFEKVRAFMQSKFGHTDGAQPQAGAGSQRSGGIGGGLTMTGGGSARVGSREPMQTGDVSNISNRDPGAGAGSRRHGGTGNPGGPEPGAFKGGKSALAGRGGHTTASTMVDKGDGSEVLKAGIAAKSTKPVDVMDVGQNRAHVGIGRDYAIAETKKDGSVHPMEHAGKMGKGRW